MGRRKAENLKIEACNYAPSDSEDDYGSNEKMLLEKVRLGHQHKQDIIDSEEAVFRVHSSSEDDDDDYEEEEEVDNEEENEGVGSDMDSDIEGRSDDGELPSSKAWGSKSKNFYHTDYVDQDFGGFSRAEEEEVAMMEEKEALAIQQRLAAELEDVDYTLGLADKIKEKKEKLKGEAAVDSNQAELIKTDLSRLSQRERIILLKKDSPEIFGLINDFKERMQYAQNNLVPILKMIKSNQVQECPFSDYISTEFQLILNYCTNILFYILLKAQRVNVTSHPVVPRLYTYRTLLRQMDPVDKQVVLPQIENILMQKQQCNPEILLNKQIRSKKRKKLKLLTTFEDVEECEQNAAKKNKMCIVKLPKNCKFNEKGGGVEEEKLAEKKLESKIEESVDVRHIPEDVDENEKRPITYQIAKNKGLTPHRKKELRNPRVKHRNKYRKAKIRRKGQVREARQELQRYAGEISGIKASVCKSIKLK